MKAVRGKQQVSLKPAPTAIVAMTKALRTFQRIKLVENMRARADPAHQQILTRMRNCVSACAKGVPLPAGMTRPLVDDIASKYAFTDDDNLAEWRESVIAVGSHMERVSINLARALQFAREKGVPVVMWLNSPGNSAMPIHSAERLAQMYVQHPGLVGMFVAGGLAVLLENLAVKAGAFNSARGRMEAMTFDEDVNEQARSILAKAQPGEVVAMPFAPRAILMQVDTLKPVVRDDHTVLCNGKRCVAVMLKQSREAQKVGKLSITVHRHYIDVAWAVTFHKVQGLTVPRLVVSFRNWQGEGLTGGVHHLNYAMAYVGMSRVPKGCDLRVVRMSEKDKVGMVGMCPRRDVMAMDACYNDEGMFDVTRVVNAVDLADSVKHAAKLAQTRAQRAIITGGRGVRGSPAGRVRMAVTPQGR